MFLKASMMFVYAAQCGLMFSVYRGTGAVQMQPKPAPIRP
jgi:hypothetical protein